MGVALILVLVVMRQARQPALYETFFGDPKGQWQPIQATQTTTTKASTGISGRANGTRIESQSETATRAPEILKNTHTPFQTKSDSEAEHWKEAGKWIEQLSVELQRSWIKTLLTLEHGPQDELTNRENLITTEDIAASREALSRVEPASDRALQVMDSIEEWIADEEADLTLPWTDFSWWAIPVLDALDHAAIARVTDGTFWTGEDSDAFYMQLVRSTTLPTDQGITAGTLQLLQQPEIYQGQSLNMVGSLGLVENVPAKENDYSVDQYWKLWMIPSDGGIRPILLICRELPAEVSEHLTPGGKWDRSSNPDNPNGEFAAVGRFLKRLPYRSSVGADLAPVVIGRVVASRGSGPSSATLKAATEDAAAGKTSTNQMRMLGLIAATVLGIAIATGLMYRTSMDAKRSRRLRNQSIAIPLPEAAFPEAESQSVTKGDS